MADITINREFIIYITEVAPLYPEDTLFPANDIYPDEGTLVIQSTTEDAGIVSGTLHIEEMIADSSMIIGQCIANKFECTLYNIPHDIAGHEITVVCKEDGSLKQMFTGYVDESTSDCYEYERHLVAYDNFYYKRDTNVADWWNNFWSNRNESTLKVLRNSLCDYVGIDYVAKTLVNDNTIIDKGEEYTTLSFGDCLKMICELQACFPNINRLGKIEFVTLPNGTTTISEYDRNQSKFISYTTAKITGVQVYADSNTLSQSIGSEDNPYSITGNIFLLNMNADEVNSCCTTLLNAIKNIEYKPVELYMIVSDLDYELGSQITTDNGTTYLFKNNLSGVLMIEQKIDSKAVGEYLEKKASTINSSIVSGRKLSKLEQTVDGFVATVEDKFENVRSEISQTANSISLGISNQKGSATITVSITDDTTGETKTSSANVNINADTINLSATDVINIIAENEIDLTSNNISINSNNFTVDNVGKVTASSIELKSITTWDETGHEIKYRGHGEPSIDWLDWKSRGIAKNDEYLDMDSGYVHTVAEIVKNIGGSTPSGTVVWVKSLDPLELVETSVSIDTPNFTVDKDGKVIANSLELLSHSSWDETGYTINYKGHGQPSMQYDDWKDKGVEVYNYYYLEVDSGILFVVRGIYPSEGLIVWEYVGTLPLISSNVSITTPNFKIDENGDVELKGSIKGSSGEFTDGFTVKIPTNSTNQNYYLIECSNSTLKLGLEGGDSQSNSYVKIEQGHVDIIAQTINLMGNVVTPL